MDGWAVTEGTATAAARPDKPQQQQQRKRRKPNYKREVDAVHMDDRSLVRGDAGSLVASVKDWQDWSEGVQMQENWCKLQMMGKTAQQQEELKAQLEETGRPQSRKRQRFWAQHQRTAAGSAPSRPRGWRSSQIALPCSKRFRSEHEQAFHVATRMLANSVASYGWVTTGPSEILLNTASSKIWSSKRLGLRGAAKHLKWMVPALTLRL